VSFDVGQILYVISSETQHIIPLLVCEEIRRRTTAGEEISYLVRGGAEMTTFDLKTVQGTIHKSIDEALAELRKSFEQFLQQQATWTVEMQRVWYRPQTLASAPPVIPLTAPPQPSSPVRQPELATGLDVPSYEELAAEAAKRAPK
jgi:hypothetical protein